MHYRWHERQGHSYTATVDISGANMHTNINKEVVHPWVHELYGENSFQVAPYVQIVTVKPIAYGKLSTALN